MDRIWSDSDTELYRKYCLPLRRYACALGASREDAEDLAQDAFESYYTEGYSSDLPDAAASALLMKIVLNAWLNRNRRRKHKVILWPDDPGEMRGVYEDCRTENLPERIAMDREYEGYLESRIRLLRKEWQEVLKMSLQELTAREGSEKLGITEEAFRGRLFRARRALRKLLENGTE